MDTNCQNQFQYLIYGIREYVLEIAEILKKNKIPKKLQKTIDEKPKQIKNAVSPLRIWI